MQIRLRLFTPALILLIALAICPSPAHAQFQRVYGGAGTESGRGVQQTFDGGFITAGESNSGVPDYDIYVVKTNTAGVTTWSFKYNIGHNDYAKHIQQTRDTGYIITGYTKDSSNCCSRDNLFLLKIDRNGTVQWVKTYGGENDEQGWCVREDRRGNGYIVAGRSNSFGQGDYDGYLMWTTAWGDVIWSRVYGERDNDYFRSCVQDSATGDVYAVGASNSYGNASEGFAVRVDGSDGALIWDYVYGLTKDEVFNSVRQISGGDLIVSGFTKSYTTTGSALLVNLNQQGAVNRSMVYRSNGVGGWSEFSDALEITPGTLGVVGLFNNVANGFGNYDMLVGQVTTWNLLMTNNRVYGGLSSDQGFSIGRVGPAGPNVISAGLTNSFGNGQQLYLIETNFSLPATCSDSAGIDTIYSDLDSIPIALYSSRAVVSCVSSASALRDSTVWDSVCSHGVEAGIQRNGWRQDDSSYFEGEGTSPVELEGAVSPTGGGFISSYPNPVRRGESFTLSYQAATGTSVTVEVADLAGRVIYSETARLVAGENRLEVSTSGWGSGSFVVRLNSGGLTDSQRIVVSD